MITKIFVSPIRVNILKGLLKLEESKGKPAKITAGQLVNVSKLRRIPSEELDFLFGVGLIDSSKKGTMRYVSLTEKGRKAAKMINEFEAL